MVVGSQWCGEGGRKRIPEILKLKIWAKIAANVL